MRPRSEYEKKNLVAYLQLAFMAAVVLAFALYALVYLFGSMNP